MRLHERIHEDRLSPPLQSFRYNVQVHPFPSALAPILPGDVMAA